MISHKNNDSSDVTFDKTIDACMRRNDRMDRCENYDLEQA
jgi:hypothetical protein